MRRHVSRALGPVLSGSVVALLAFSAPRAPSPASRIDLPRLPSAVSAFERSGDSLRVDGALPARVDARGAIGVASRGTELELSLASIGRTDGRARRPSATRVEDGRAVVARGDVREWVVSTAIGLEHGFDLARRIEGDGDVTLRLAVSGARARQHGADTELVTDDGDPRFEYRDLVVVDAAGERLRSTMRARGDAIELSFDDRDAVYPIRVDPLLVTAFATISEALVDQESDAQCGFSVAIEGNVAIVGCPADDGPGPISNVGAVLVFSRADATSGWTAAGRLVPPTPFVDGRFGHSVAFDGTTLVVGAPGTVEASKTDAGVAYAFRNVPGFTPFATIYPTRITQSGKFGWSVAVAGDVVVVGSPDGIAAAGSTATGIVSAFTISGGTTTFVAEATGPTPADGDRFGESISLRGSTLVVGAPLREGPSNLNNAGAAYVLSASASGVNSATPLVDPSPVATGRFGADVASSGAGYVVGKPHGDAPTLGNTGSIVIYDASGTLVREASATDRVASDTFGVSVAMEGPFIVVGASATETIVTTTRTGGAYLFVLEGSRWLEAGKLLPSDAALGDVTGFDVAIDSGTRTAVLGVPRDSLGSNLRVGSAKTAQIPEYHVVHVTILDGGGSVESAPSGIACPSDCDEVFGANAAAVNLTPTAFAGYYLADVSGDCSGVPCSVTTTTNRSVTFDFQPQRDLGEACDEGVQCLSDFCVDGVCCNEACVGGESDCQACSTEAGAATDGTCGAIADQNDASAIVCRASVGPCDVEETCDHTSRVCPANALAGTDVECRPAQHPICDTAEFCTGSVAQCPQDVVAAADLSCDDGSACTGTEACDGEGACVSTNAVQCASDGNPCTVDLCLDTAGCVSVEQPGCIVVDGGAVFPGADAGTSSQPRLEGGGGCNCTVAGPGSVARPVLAAWVALLSALVLMRRRRAVSAVRSRER